MGVVFVGLDVGLDVGLAVVGQHIIFFNHHYTNC